MQAKNNNTGNSEEHTYLAEQLGQLARQTSNALISALAAMVFVLYVVSDVLDIEQLLLWAGLVLMANLYLYFWNQYYQRLGTGNNLHTFLYTYQLQSIAHGLLWGGLPFMLVEVKTAELQFLAYYVICGMAAGAVAITGMIYRIYLSFMLPMLLPIILYQLIGQNNIMFDNGGLGILIIFFLAMLSLSYAHYESVLRGIRLMFENEMLLDDLRDAYHRSEKANKAKTDFLSNMSHELRTPLNAIMGFSSLLITFSKSKRPEKTREFASNISEAGKHLSALINQVLDLTSIESGETKVELKPLPLASIMQECIQLLMPMAENQQVILRHESNVCSDNHQYILGDELRLRQVLINLISNAIKYNVKSGKVTVRCVFQNNSVMVEVIDTGLGIAKADQPSIFNPFSRAHLDAHVEGSGIGLAVTKKNLTLMNSEICFQSRYGEGSRFWFVLPAADAPEPAVEITKKLPDQQVDEKAVIKLLYVEDNPLGMRLMEEIMSSHDDVQLYQAATGIEGCELALEVEPDIIILDINLPDIDGIEVLRRLRLHAPMNNVPLVALSASTMADDVRKGLQAGFTHYLRKPFEPDELFRLIYELTAGAK